MQTSNEQLKDVINQEITVLVDRANKLFYQFEKEFNKEFSENLDKVVKETMKTIKKLENVKGKANDKFTTYYNQNKWIDYMIIGYMLLTK